MIKYNCFGKTGTLDPTYNKGRTATHEIGHWLNLIHIWGDDDNNNGTCTSNECTGTDNVTDTPNQGEANYGCPTFPKTDCCTTTSPGVMYMNFMDYTDDACMNLFTSGQKDRMRALFSSGGFRECFATNTILDDWCQSNLMYSGPSLICTTNSFSIINLPSGTSVTWDESANLTENPAGTFSANGSGSGWVEATLTNNCGSITLPRKTVWVGTPAFTGLIHGNVSIPIGSTQQYWVDASEMQGQHLTVYDWDVTSRLEMVSSHYYQQDVFVEGITLGRGSVYFISSNVCGQSQSSLPVIITDMLLLALTPNPADSETLLSIESALEESSFDETAEWDLEVYDNAQSLKEKKTKLKGKEHKLNTTGWKEGVYVVRVKYKDQILTDKLVVKK